MCLLVSVGLRQVRLTANVNGEKVGKVELASKFGSVVSSQVVEHNRMFSCLCNPSPLIYIYRIACTGSTDG